MRKAINAAFGGDLIRGSRRGLRDEGFALGVAPSAVLLPIFKRRKNGLAKDINRPDECPDEGRPGTGEPVPRGAETLNGSEPGSSYW